MIYKTYPFKKAQKVGGVFLISIYADNFSL